MSTSGLTREKRQVSYRSMCLHYLLMRYCGMGVAALHYGVKSHATFSSRKGIFDQTQQLLQSQ